MPAIPFTNDEGLRDYRHAGELLLLGERASRSWPWPFLVVVAFLVGWVFGAHTQAAEPCVQLQVRPQILLFRGDVDVQARVARHVDHRTLNVAWDSDAGAGGSRTFGLEGDRDQALFQWWNRAQPAANYVFEARVYDAGGRQVGFDRAQIRTADAQ
jgi:hypothetical protein